MIRIAPAAGSAPRTDTVAECAELAARSPSRRRSPPRPPACVAQSGTIAASPHGGWARPRDRIRRVRDVHRSGNHVVAAGPDRIAVALSWPCQPRFCRGAPDDSPVDRSMTRVVVGLMLGNASCTHEVIERCWRGRDELADTAHTGSSPAIATPIAVPRQNAADAYRRVRRFAPSRTTRPPRARRVDRCVRYVGMVTSGSG